MIRVMRTVKVRRLRMPEALEYARDLWLGYVPSICPEAKNPQILTSMVGEVDVLYRSFDFDDLAAYEVAIQRLTGHDQFKKRRAKGEDLFVDGSASLTVMRIQ